MAKNTIGNLHIEVDIALQKMQAQLDQMGKRVQGATKKSTRNFTDFAAAAKASLASLGVGLSIGALTQGVRSVIDFGSKITDLSKQANISTDAFQALGLEARRSDVSYEQLSGTLAFFRKSLSESIAGMGEARQSFKALGLDATALAKLPTERALELIARATAGADDKGTAYAHTLKILGEGSKNLQGLLQTLAEDGFAKVEASAKGLTLDPATLARLKEADITLDRTGVRLKILTADLIVVGDAAQKAFSEQTWGEKIVLGPLRYTSDLIGAVIDRVNQVSTAAAGAAESTAALADQMARVAAEATIAAEQAKAFAEGQAFIVGHLAEGDKERAEAVRELVTLNERAARLGERQAAAALDALHPLDRAVALKNRLIGLEAQQAEVTGGTIDALQLQLDYEEKIFEVRQQLNGLGTTVDESLDLFFANLDDASTSMGKLDTATEKATKTADELGNVFSSAFEDAIVNGGKFKDILRGLGQDILRLIVRQTISAPIASWVSAGFAGLFGGGKAKGGGVDPEKLYIVGEEGPEAFIPDSAGTIIPAAQTQALREGGSGGGNIYQIDARGADREGLNRLEGMIYALHGSIEHRAIAAVVDGKRRRGAGLNGAFA